jgi:hypothetical protein
MGLIVAIMNTQDRVAAHGSNDSSFYQSFPLLYTVWAWMAFALNSTLSFSMLIRIQYAQNYLSTIKLITVHEVASATLAIEP